MSNDPIFSLTELVDAAKEVMRDWPAPDNRRIRAMPDVRTLRYYTQLGLLDRPIAFRGRTALYGRRHLLQVLAVKRLQFSGRSLEQIQEDLYGADAASLEQVVGGELPPAAAPEKVAAEAVLPRSAAFWTERPEPFGLDDRAAVFAIEPKRVIELSVSPGARLVLPVEQLSEEAFAELPAAVAPLKEWLAKYVDKHKNKPDESGER